MQILSSGGPLITKQDPLFKQTQVMLAFVTKAQALMRCGNLITQQLAAICIFQMSNLMFYPRAKSTCQVAR